MRNTMCKTNSTSSALRYPYFRGRRSWTASSSKDAARFVSPRDLQAAARPWSTSNLKLLPPVAARTPGEALRTASSNACKAALGCCISRQSRASLTNSNGCGIVDSWIASRWAWMVSGIRPSCRGNEPRRRAPKSLDSLTPPRAGKQHFQQFHADKCDDGRKARREAKVEIDPRDHQQGQQPQTSTASLIVLPKDGE